MAVGWIAGDEVLQVAQQALEEALAGLEGKPGTVGSDDEVFLSQIRG
jgi:hypothetical protein